jgi:hypothetical protein
MRVCYGLKIVKSNRSGNPGKVGLNLNALLATE